MFMEFTIFDETLKMFPVSYGSFSFCLSLSLSHSLLVSIEKFRNTKTHTKGVVRFCEWRTVNVNAMHRAHGFSSTEWNINMCVLVLLWKCRIMLFCLYIKKPNSFVFFSSPQLSCFRMCFCFTIMLWISCYTRLCFGSWFMKLLVTNYNKRKKN